MFIVKPCQLLMHGTLKQFKRTPNQITSRSIRRQVTYLCCLEFNHYQIHLSYWQYEPIFLDWLKSITICLSNVAETKLLTDGRTTLTYSHSSSKTTRNYSNQNPTEITLGWKGVISPSWDTIYTGKIAAPER